MSKTVPYEKFNEFVSTPEALQRQSELVAALERFGEELRANQSDLPEDVAKFLREHIWEAYD